MKLNAPKGLTIAGGVLYVSDISTVRKFDPKTGAAKGEIAVPGSTFLNDIASAPDGRVFVADSGIKPGANGFDPTGTDAIYVIDKGKLKPLIKSKDLGGPNGLIWTDKGLLVDTFNSNEIYRVDDKGVRQDITKLPEGGLDGIIAAGDKLFVTSWKASPGLLRQAERQVRGGDRERLLARGHRLRHQAQSRARAAIHGKRGRGVRGQVEASRLSPAGADLAGSLNGPVAMLGRVVSFRSC